MRPQHNPCFFKNCKIAIDLIEVFYKKINLSSYAEVSKYIKYYPKVQSSGPTAQRLIQKEAFNKPLKHSLNDSDMGDLNRENAKFFTGEIEKQLFIQCVEVKNIR
jgi:hypothetical protein